MRVTQAKLFPDPSPEEQHRQWCISLLRSMVERYPLTEEEKRALPKGVRPSRFVILLECDKCEYSCHDHTLAWRYPMKVCLKDLVKRGYCTKEEALR